MAIGKAKAKVKKVFTRRAQTGIAAAPTSSFTNFNNYIRTEVDKKDVTSTIKSYIKQNFSKEDYRIAQSAPDWSFTCLPFLAATIAWKALGNPFPANWNDEKVIKEKVQEIISRGVAKQEVKAEASDSNKKTIADIIKERTSDFIANIEDMVDAFPDDQDVSVYDELKKIDAPNNTAKAIHDFYMPQLEEMQELLNKKTPDLIEGYSHMSKNEQKQYMKFLEGIILDAERYMASKKAQRKSRAPKVKTADAQVKKINYLKESKEYKLVSIDPAQIVGSGRIYLFNTKYRVVTELITMSPKGFEVSGSTIKGVDMERSRSTKLRKPEEFLSIVLKKSATQVGKEWDKLTTKPSVPNGRVNKETILMKVHDK